MASWETMTNHSPSSINGGQRYEKGDRVSREQLNSLAENSFYAVNKSIEAITKSRTALSNSENAVSVADKANIVAYNANETAEFANGASQTAITNSEQAVTTANNANTKSDTALTNSQTAVTNSNSAFEKANTALSNSNEAKTTATSAEAVANGIDAKATEALTNSQTAVTTANEAKTLAQQVTADVWQTIYPIGSVYISTDPTDPADLFGGTWSEIAPDRTLWFRETSVTVVTGKNIEAGLPNITGVLTGKDQLIAPPESNTGALYTVRGTTSRYVSLGGSSGSRDAYQLAFDASKSNSIYGKSATVQPPAVTVFGWIRES